MECKSVIQTSTAELNSLTSEHAIVSDGGV